MKPRKGDTIGTEGSPKRAILYARASTSRQEQKQLSIPAQFRRLRDHSLHNNISVALEVSDSCTGTHDRRPGFQQMLRYIEEHPGEINLIITWDMSRFMRNRRLAVHYKYMLRKQGVRVLAVTQDLGEGIEADMGEGMLEIFDAHRSHVTCRDAIRGVTETALQGHFPLSQAPFGFTREEVRHGKARRFKLAKDEAWAPLVLRIFDMYVRKGQGGKEIAHQLNEEDLLPPSGKWNKNRILRIIRNPIYIGTLCINFDTELSMLLPPEERQVTVENFCEPLVDREVFELAQQEREERTRTHPKHIVGDHLLSGLLRCARCGAKLFCVSAKSGQYFYYACGTYWNVGSHACSMGMISRQTLEDLILGKVRDLLLCEEHIRPLVEATNRALQDELRQLQAEYAALGRQYRSRAQAIDRLLDLVEGGQQVPEKVWERINERQEQAVSIKARLDELEQWIESLRADAIPDEEVVRFATFLAHNLRHAPVREQRKILRSFIAKIVVDKDKIAIHYRVPKPKSSQRRLKDLDLVSSAVTPGTPGRN